MAVFGAVGSTKNVTTWDSTSPTPGATVTITISNLTSLYKWTAGENETVNASAVGTDGQRITFLIQNDATLARTITFGTNLGSMGTLIGTISKYATITFISNGSKFYELCRTLAIT